MKLFQQNQKVFPESSFAKPNPNFIKKFVQGTTLAVLSTTTFLSIFLASFNSNNTFNNVVSIDPTSLVSEFSDITFTGQSAVAQVTSNGKAQQLDIKLIKINKDGSQEYKVNSKTIKVTKKQIDTIKLELKKFYAYEQLKITSFKENDYKKYIKASGVANSDSLHTKFKSERKVYLENVKNGTFTTIQAVPAWGASVAGLIDTIQAHVGVWSWNGSILLARTCGVRPDNCAKTLMLAWQGSGVAYNQLKQWARG